MRDAGSTPPTSTSTTSAPAETPSAMTDNTSGLVGPGCADYARANPSGAGSVDGMAAAPVNLMVNNAKVICGGVKTANATVYLIDTVLMPPAA